MSLLKEALEYYDKGMSIIPIGKDKKPLVPWLMYQKTRASKELITKWFTSWPDANIGIVTGKISGLTVVDVDNEAKYDWLPETATVKTGKGVHLYYQYAEDIGNYTRIKPDVDIRGNGGYVVAPPSVHASGHQYKWIEGIPQTLTRFPTESLFVESKKQVDWKSILEGVKTGNRNSTAAQVAGKLLAAFPKSEWNTSVWQALKGWNDKNVPPMSEKELRSVFESIAKTEYAGSGAFGKRVTSTNGISLVSMGDVLKLGMDEVLATKPEDCISFGYKFLDDPLTGLFPGDLVILGSETGGGKTTLSTNIMYKAAARGIKSVLFALEDRIEDYGIKALYFRVNSLRKKAGREPIPWNEFRKNDISDKEQFRMDLSVAKQQLANDNVMFVRTEVQMNIDLLEKTIEKSVSEGIKLFLIDHLHYFDLASRDMSKADYIEAVMVRLKGILNRTGARAILIVHYRKLNGNKPNLDSFKDSISIAQNANYVINVLRNRSVEPDKTIGYRPMTKFHMSKVRNPNGEALYEVLYDPEKGDYDEESAILISGNKLNKPPVTQENYNEMDS